MDANRRLIEISKYLEDTIALYDEIISYDAKLIDMLNDSNLNMDNLDEYLEEKDILSDRLDILSESLDGQISEYRLTGITDTTLNALCNQLLDREKKVLELENQAKVAIETYISNKKTEINTNRKNASKAQKYMANMNNISMVADTYIDTSKKI